MRKGMIIAVFVLVALCACSKPQTPKLETDEQKALYTLGVYLYRDSHALDMTPEDFTYIDQGMADAVSGRKARVDLKANLPKIAQMVKSRIEKRKAQARECIEKVASEKGAKKTASGMVYKEIAAGTGAMPKDKERIKVQYTGTFIGGKEFDSTFKRGKAAEYTMGEILPCFSEGVGMMKVGGKARFYCPPETAYGDAGNPPIISGGTLLIYDVELLETKPALALKADE